MLFDAAVPDTLPGQENQLTNVSSFTTGLHIEDDTQRVGKQIIMLITENQRLVLLNLEDGQVIFNKTLSHLQFPEISAIFETANMKVINNTAYVGSFNGTVYELHVTEDAGNVSVNISTIKLNLFCIPEVFIDKGSDVIAACFGNEISTLYFVNVHSPTERSELKFTKLSDLSNILAVGNVFYFFQNGHLLRGDTSGQRIMESLQGCIQPLLILNRNCCIIIQCPEKSFVFSPPEWSSAPGIRRGEWENKKVYPCYGIGPIPLVFSSDGAAITFYDIRNDFQQTIRVNGTPAVNSILCAWSNDDIVLVYQDLRCDCWIEHKLNSNFEDKNLAHGTLHPLSTSKGNINQNILLFYPDTLQYLLIPSANQVLLDLKSNFFHTDITSNVVLYHNMVFIKAKKKDTGKKGSNKKLSAVSHSWPVYVSVAIIVSLIISGIVFYYLWKRKHRNEVIMRYVAS